ncbi:CinA family protein [bacterium]|nr:CinA family protein [bacterium]
MVNEFDIAKILIKNKLTVSTAESCTGGLLSSKLTDVSGSSAYITLNFVTYANEAKESILGVKHSTLENFGAVSEECVKEMAQGTLKVTNSDIALCTSGVAGPTESENKPAGTLWVSVGIKGEIYTRKFTLPHNIPRIEMKEKFANSALDFLGEILTKNFD